MDECSDESTKHRLAPKRSRAAAGVLLALACSLGLSALGRPYAEKYLAVIVHPDNPIQDLKLSELRTILKLDRQSWSDRRRIELYLPPAESIEKGILNDKIYDMTEKELGKYWLGKIYAGEIASSPSVVRTASAAGRLVSKSVGAVSVVLSTGIPPNVRVLTIDGRGPGSEGYPLVQREDPKPAPAP